uniref:Ras-GEF domain-containing protein n=1 Tax=Timema cristinae TaxID=61476 RepID=A0A7R9GSK8_TIMCR|nr:unnamed protein product [Timema cristinae]
MFAIVSGLGHGAVSRLRLSWEKLPSKYQKLFSDLQDLMDPSRNMSKYRQLIPFYPVVKKDLTFIHLGNDSKVEDLINFEKLRMIAKEVRALTNMCSIPRMTCLQWGQPPSSAMVALNQLTTGTGQCGQHNVATVKRRKKSTAQPNPKKMFEEAQMVRRVKAYLNNMRVLTDEDKLHILSLECEPSGSAPNSAPVRKRHPSPTLSTTSSTSSTSEGKKCPPGTKFDLHCSYICVNYYLCVDWLVHLVPGAASPQAVRKMLALSEPGKTRPHQPRHPPPLPLPGLAGHHPLSPSPSPGSHRRVASSVLPGVVTREQHGGGRSLHERSHSDTPTLPVDLNAESSSVTSLSNLPLRKTLTSGSVTSSDSGHSTQLDSHSGSSLEVGHLGSCSPPPQHRRHSVMQVAYSPPSKLWARPPPFPHAVAVLPPVPMHGSMPPPREIPPRPRQPPAYNVAAHMARLQRLGRAHSHEGVTGGYYHTDPEEDDDEDAQVSAV